MLGERWLFARPPEPQGVGQIIWWWEARRLHYNVVVFAGIVLAWFLALWPVWKMPQAGVTFTLLIAYSVLFIQVPANIWYTGGWVVDLILKRGLRKQSAGFGPWALGVGMVFSVVFIIAVIIWAHMKSVNV